ncbi:lytic polysaccharide monooxygenase [Vibrio ostreicida]|uniref:lytic polysaccharide monooxygenase n=1 Tax=Vibrio ostreicida TaxID=526588 RepID=UPI0009712680|nr:lytic polysaccharide monooxygenase [Vibrio ostreicida]
MNTCLNVSSVAIASLISLTSLNSQAHGWVEFPNARQNICYLDGGFWDNRIPNPACQAAFDQSGAFPFVQRNEIAANVANYQDMGQVQTVVSNGELCSAGDPAKVGLNVPSPHWQKTAVSLDEQGQFELIFNATAPHNPSYWQFYLSRPEYDPAQPLTWSDLDLIGNAGNISVDANKKYRITLKIPSGRSGDAILYTRWQRRDPAGEGFYNCSDIRLTENGRTPTDPTTPTEPNTELYAIGYFVPQDLGSVEAGDTLRLRTFDQHGNEQHDLSLAITANNTEAKIWSTELAGQFNSLGQDRWVVGTWHAEMNHYMFDTHNIYSNQVYAPNTTFNYQLSLHKGNTPPPQPDNLWSSTQIYQSGDVVTHDGKRWTAQWWTRGEVPGQTGQWGAWR